METLRLEPIGETFVNGLSSSYANIYPTESPEFNAMISEIQFQNAMTNINECLMDHWPCLPCKGFAYGCFCCTCGTSLYFSSSMVKEAEEFTREQLCRINRQPHFQNQNISWTLTRKWCPFPHSWIQITFPSNSIVSVTDQEKVTVTNSPPQDIATNPMDIGLSIT